VDILKPVWFLAFPRPNGLMAGREKIKSWLPARQIGRRAVIPGLENAEDFPRTGKRRGLSPDKGRRGLSPDKKRRGLYSGKIVFGFFRKPF
jgi:hypothetical protein